MNRAWRGARVKESDLLAQGTPGVSIDFLPISRRHIWVLARKN